MKKTIALVASLFYMGVVFAQVQVGSKQIPVMNSPGKLTTDDIDEFKKTTTLFTLQSKDYEHVEDFEKILKKVWTITPYKIIEIKDLGEYESKGTYSAFIFGGFVVQHSNGHGMTTQTNSHLTYELVMPHHKKNGDINGMDYYAQIFLSPDINTLRSSAFGINLYGRNAKWEEKMMYQMYNEALFSNWSAGYLKGYLKFINDHLLEAEMNGPYTGLEENEDLKKLKTDTLYVPDYVFNKFNMFTGAEKSSEDDEADESRKEAYPYPLKVVTSEELNKLIVNSEKSIFYLTYCRSSTDKFVNIFRSKSGKMVYAKHASMSYNFKYKDLKKIAKLIE